MFCQKCGTRLESTWNICPKCSTNIRSKINSSNNMALFAIIALIAFGFFFSVYLDTTTNTPNTVSVVNPRQVLCTVVFEKGNIIIKNENDFDWENTKLAIVQGITDQYVKSAGKINKGETIVIPASDFANSDGVRFNPYKSKPLRVMVNATNASGGWELKN